MIPIVALVSTLATQTYTSGPPSLDGIGKFYYGREIAQVMGHQGASWLDRPEREAEEAPSLLIKALRLRPGMNVADIGAGTGALSFPMAKQVAPGGVVFAVEIQPELLDIIRTRSKQRGVKNVRTVLGTTTNPKVPENSMDLMLLVDVYHEFDFPREMVTNMIRGLKKGGRLVLVEYRGEDPEVPIKPLHKMTEAQVRKEMADFPLDFIQNDGILPRQHILTFRKR